MCNIITVKIEFNTSDPRISLVKIYKLYYQLLRALNGSTQLVSRNLLKPFVTFIVYVL